MLRMTRGFAGVVFVLALSTSVPAATGPASTPEEIHPALTLAEALALALENNPELAAYNLEIRAREA